MILVLSMESVLKILFTNDGLIELINLCGGKNQLDVYTVDGIDES